MRNGSKLDVSLRRPCDLKASHQGAHLGTSGLQHNRCTPHRFFVSSVRSKWLCIYAYHE